MKVNEGSTDRIVRGVLGLVLLIVSISSLQGAAGWIVGIIGGVLLVTAASGFCGLYSLLKINTKKHKPTS